MIPPFPQIAFCEVCNQDADRTIIWEDVAGSSVIVRIECHGQVQEGKLPVRQYMISDAMGLFFRKQLALTE